MIKTGEKHEILETIYRSFSSIIFKAFDIETNEGAALLK
jgi:hypothetical protein